MSEAWIGRPVVVTGGLGFIGSNLAIRLADEGARVTVVDLPDPLCAGQVQNIAQAADRITLLRADLSVPGEWQRTIQQSEIVFHLAAQVSHSASMWRPAVDLQQNCGALLGVLEAARLAPRPPRIVFTSTRQIYGRAISIPIRESHPLHPTDVNGIHKVAAEEYLRIYREVHGVRSVTIRLANTYGPRMDIRNAGRGVLNVFLARALKGEPITVFGDGSQVRDVNFIDDVVEALVVAAGLDDQGPFHLGAVAPTSLNQFLDELNSILPVDVTHVPFPADAQAIDIGDSHCDFARFHDVAGWSPSTTLEDGLRRTIDWFHSEQHSQLPLRTKFTAR
jgi:nucleoside-diphosphate-sugar epimerase